MNSPQQTTNTMNLSPNDRPRLVDGHHADRPLTRSCAPWIQRAALVLVPVLLLVYASAETATITPLGRWPGVNRAEPFPARGYGVLDRYATSGHYAFVSAGLGGVVIVDLADPAPPRRVAAHQTEGWISDVAVSGSIACVVDRPNWTQSRLPELLVLDVANPSQPTFLGSYEPDTSATSAGNLFAVTMAGHYAFVADQGVWSSSLNGPTRGGLHVVDLSDPRAPRRVAGINSAPVYGVVVSGNYAYLAAVQSGLLVVDIADPTAPRVVGSASLGGHHARDLLVVGDRAYVYGGDVWIFDISNPRAPRELARHFGHWTTLVSANGPYLHVLEQRPPWTFETTAVQVMDYTMPTQPVILGEYNISHFQNEIRLAMVRDDRLHLYGKTSQGTVLETLDISQPYNPYRIASARFDLGGSAAQDVKVSGHHAYLADQTGLRIFDISDPLNPDWVTDIEVASLGGWEIGESRVRRLEFHGHLVGILEDWLVKGEAYERSRLHLLDISNPARPSRRGTYEYGGFISDVVLKGNYAFLASYGVFMNSEFFDGGLEVLDLSSPGDPMLVNIIPTEGRAGAVAASGDLLLVGTSGPSPGIEIFDISDPSQPRRIALWEPEQGQLAFHPSRRGLTISGSLAWINAEHPGLLVIDISNPSHPITASHKVGGVGYLDITGDRLFGYRWAATQDGGGYQLQEFDVSDPANPRLVGQMPAGAYVADPAAITVVDNHVYLASRVEGLRIFRVDPANLVPQLVIGVTGNDLHLRWPSTATGFELESSVSLESTTWDPVPGTPRLNGDEFELTIPTDGAARYWRLRKP